ncbi:acyltransferase [Niveibacterium sp. 24ML]|uniref:acyltransferase family protein n=1 Tax=Niveibacterium sp. 24ML TaxID=2985512 RepID=UPI0022710A70|nr:acyltransferase [Niveibacterium sp. 24ML]MCX9154726.1 acyltransferase [Niveibacterium sp. 24ML]
MSHAIRAPGLPSADDRIDAIDGLRFIAAISVLMFHFAFRCWNANSPGVMAYPILSGIAQYGYLGVDLFFMISGFVILMSAGHGEPRKFVRSRFLRLYPAYWACVALTFIWLSLAATGNPPGALQLAANLTMLQSLFAVPDLDGSYWTLAVELQFYALIFVVLLLRQLPRIDLVLAAWLALALVADRIPALGALSGALALKWCHYFVAGAICFRIRSAGLTPLRAAILALAFLQALRKGLWYMDLKERLTAVPYEPIVVLVAICVFFTVFLWLARGGGPKRIAGLAYPGALTYPLYLIHGEIGTDLLMMLADRGVNRWLALVAITALMLGAAHLILRRVEGPLSHTLKRWLATARLARAA